MFKIFCTKNVSKGFGVLSSNNINLSAAKSQQINNHYGSIIRKENEEIAWRENAKINVDFQNPVNKTVENLNTDINLLQTHSVFKDSKQSCDVGEPSPKSHFTFGFQGV